MKRVVHTLIAFTLILLTLAANEKKCKNVFIITSNSHEFRRNGHKFKF